MAANGMACRSLRSAHAIRGSLQTGRSAQAPPGGETDEAGAARGLRALQIIADGPGKTLAAVAHASLNRLILSAVLDRPYCTKKAIPQPNACVSVLVYDGQWRAEQVGLSAEEWARENA